MITQTGEKVLLLRTCLPDGTSYNRFKWPLKVGSVVEAPDWDPKPECGGGLHGLLWGSGDGNLLNWIPNAKWLVIEANKSDVVEIDNAKAKCKKCKVVHIGKSNTEEIKQTQRVRTYNFFRGFVKDHRSGFQSNNVQDILDGNLDNLIESLKSNDSNDLGSS